MSVAARSAGRFFVSSVSDRVTGISPSMSRMSFTRPRRNLDEVSILARQSTVLGGLYCSRARYDMPMMPLSGVRISWLMLLVCSRRNIRRGDPAERIFGWMMWLTAALCAMEMLSFIIDGKQFFGARPLIYAVNSLLYSVNVMFVYLWVQYIDYKLFEDTSRLKKRNILLAAPGLAVLIMVLVNLFTPVIFTVSPDNVYSRTPLTIFTFAVSFFYLAYSELVIYTNRNNAQRYLFLPSVIFILPILVCSVIQMLFYGISIIWAALSISVVSVYINVQCGFSSVDSLSGVYTRQYLDDYLQRITGERRDTSLAGLMPQSVLPRPLAKKPCPGAGTSR